MNHTSGLDENALVFVEVNYNSVIITISMPVMPYVPLESSQSSVLDKPMSNEEVYTNLVNTHLDEIYNFSYHMLFDHEEAQDVAQKTFIALHKNILKLNLNFPVKAWLFRVARNNCLDVIKRKKALLFSDLEEESLEIPSEDSGLETRLDDVLFLESFKEQLKDLPANVREIMVMKYYEDLTFEEISDILARPLNTVKSQFYRGKVRLYKIIKGL